MNRRTVAQSGRGFSKSTSIVQLANEKRGLVVISALINFVDYLNREGVLDCDDERLRGQLVKDFLRAHSTAKNYLLQADQIADILGAPLQETRSDD